MSISLFLSRIYDKEAPFITCKSLSGEVHYQSNIDKGKNKLRYYIDYTYFYLFKKYYKKDTNFFVSIFTF